MIPEPGVVEALQRLIAGGPFDASGNGFPEPWRGIIGRLAMLDVTERPEILRQELQQVNGSDSGRLLDTILGTNEDGGSAGGALKAALEYHDRGWSVVPVKPGTKRPACRWLDFQHNRASEEQLRSWFDPAQGKHFEDIAVVLGDISGRLAVRDFDEAGAYQRWAEDHREYAGALPTVKTARGWHVYIRLPEDSCIKGTVNLGDGELRAGGGIVLLPPSRHPEGAIYEWIVPLPDGDLPELDPHKIGFINKAIQPPKLKSSGTIPESQRNATLTSMAGSMRRRGMTPDSINVALQQENTTRCQPPLLESEVIRIAESVGRYSPAVSTASDEMHLTDLGNARRLVARHGHDLRYVGPWKKWLVWDGGRWCPDEIGEVSRRAKETVISIYAEAETADDETARKNVAKWGMRSEAEKQIRAMVQLARTEVGIPVLPSALDTDHWLLNCANGTLDLRLGELREHTREDLITKQTSAIYDDNAACPQWLAFLDRITNSDRELQSFLQRAVGYSLTGDTSEQALFILYGSGSNGKSTFLEVVRRLLGDYSLHTPTETLMVKRGQSIPNDLARLAGARLVTAAETEDGHRLAEGLVKQLTGGDTITARFLNREFFDFQPTFKLFLAANHKPQVRGSDHATWRRIRLIPFTVTIPNEEQDKRLLAKLTTELPGILRWAVEGCRAWQRVGLDEPSPVRSATAGYREEMDILGQFLEARCTVTPEARVSSTPLYIAYKSWCEDNGEQALTQTAFSLRLKERGLEKRKCGGVIKWRGLGLASHEGSGREESR